VSRSRTFAAGLSALALTVSLATPARADDESLSLRNSFRIGSSGVVCTAQNAPADQRLTGIFDRAYRLNCRDAASAVGTLLVARRDVKLGTEPTSLPGTELVCGGEGAVRIEGLGDVPAVLCRDSKVNVDYRRYALRRDGRTYLVEGLAGYDPALRLALASVIEDRAIPGEIKVASTEVSDAAAFARVQAGQLDATDARDEAYLRNNGGRFAESAEFFESLGNRSKGTANQAEALANQGLQQSNLGNFQAAARLFSQSAGSIARGDGVTQRLLRNYRAINQLNQRKPQAALRELAAKVEPVSAQFEEAKLRDGFINLPLADQINRENAGLQRLGGVDAGLTDAERAEILDAQAESLTATALRQEGKLDEASALFAKASSDLDAVRDGRVTSASWLRSENLIELALIAEAQGKPDEAAGSFDRAIAAIGAAFPQSPALLAAKARKAAFLGRSGQTDAAKALYAEVVGQSPGVPDSGTTLRDLLPPYFGLLASEGGADAAKAMFTASQVLQRPGVAQTQAILAREMSEGNDEASSLFRLSVSRSRDIARTEADIARLGALAQPTPQDIQNLASARATLSDLQREQTGLVSKLAAFPRYNVLAPQQVDLSELQGALRDGEAYYKLMAVGQDLYGLFVTSASAQVFKVDESVAQLSADVQALRDTVVKFEDGKQVNYPFDVVKSRELYLKLFGAIDPQIAGVKHLIFEPDGAMLQLPPSVLVTDDKSVKAYTEQADRPDGDPFDFTGVAWLGRGREMSIAVSPRGFLDIRKLAPSSAPRNYLGLGENAIPQAKPLAAVADECDWPLATWQNPIKPDELYFAQGKLDKGGSAVRVENQFTDSALLSGGDLDQYRVLHFATHGLVTAPRADCPARPALVTSFGDQGSDGLLTFKEIFDLKLDADLVILSACDTAGIATVSASREAGVTSGGNYALDGLVRAFVGAGARSVIASHWPVPDDFDATKRLIGGMIDGKPGEPLARSLSAAEEKLMDDPNTSHPFYWAAFIILGDGNKALIPAGRAGAEPVSNGATARK
jgi:CHAT domain-containing protein